MNRNNTWKTMKGKKVLTTLKVIINPTAGRGAGEQSIPVIETELRQRSLDYELVRTERPWHAVELARQAVSQGFDPVVAAGGDGTANEVLNGLVTARQDGLGQAAMGVISVGRGNDFAYGVGTPLDISQACQALALNQRLPLDVGRVTGGLYPQGRYFGNGVGIGFDAVVGFEALKMKRLTGFISYLVAALKTMFLYYHAPLVRIEYDHQNLELRTLMVSVMNGRRMGGGFFMAPRAMTDDSLFDVCIAREVNQARILSLIGKFLKGSQGGDPAIQFIQTRKLTVTALQGSLPAHADGETLCEAGDRLMLEILPRFLEIISPATPGM